jgi:hypothetical protein
MEMPPINAYIIRIILYKQEKIFQKEIEDEKKAFLAKHEEEQKIVDEIMKKVAEVAAKCVYTPDPNIVSGNYKS